MATVAMLGPLGVLLVALVVRLLARGSPQKLALIRVGAAGSLVAKSLTNFAGGAIHFEYIFGTELRGACAELWQVTLMVRSSAHLTRILGLAGIEVTALPCSTCSIWPQGTGVWIAAGIVAVVLEATVTLLPFLYKTIATHWRFEEGQRLVT